ncbi:MAG: acetyl-CoA carboxylase, carboxyltransferase subunit beta [Solitalea-like symbiont of Acarus siro]
MVLSWLKNKKTNVTDVTNKKDMPEGLWDQCKACKTMLLTEDYVKNLYVCPDCGHHSRIGSKEYLDIFFNAKYEELFSNLISADPINFVDTKPYTERLEETKEKTKLKDAIKCAVGNIGSVRAIIACMDFSFIGGSMGSVVGEKISLSIDYAIKNKIPLVIISKSGGARMMEAAFSLMQMAKTAAKLTLLAKAKIPYISYLTDPTTGGVTASFAMLGDFNISEPGAMIGFAGPRVIKETIKKDLPKDFQSAEFVLEHGFLDFIEDRRKIKQKIENLLQMLGF